MTAGSRTNSAQTRFTTYIAGRADLMDLYGTGSVTHAGTFNGSLMSAAAVTATQKFLDNDPPYDRVAEYGTSLMKAILSVADEHGVPLQVHGDPSAFHMSLGPDVEVRTLEDLQHLRLGLC